MLQIQDLSIEYRISEGSLPVIRNVSLDIEPGRVTALIGESGSGKTTISGAVLGLMAPNARVLGGQILWNGRDLLRMSPEQLRRFRWHAAAVVFQAAQGAFSPTLTIGQQMLDVCADHGAVMSDMLTRREELLRRVRLEPSRVINAYPHQLSGGMRQRALIAMSLMLQPELLILDEPTTALDLITQSYVFDILAELQREHNLTMIFITHDLAAVARLADRVAVLYAGSLAEVGEADNVFSDPKHPYTQGLLDSVPDLHGSLPGQRARSIEGLPPDLLRLPSGCVFRGRCPHAFQLCAEEVPPLYTARGAVGRGGRRLPLSTDAPERQAESQAGGGAALAPAQSLASGFQPTPTPDPSAAAQVDAEAPPGPPHSAEPVTFPKEAVACHLYAQP